MKILFVYKEAKIMMMKPLLIGQCSVNYKQIELHFCLGGEV